MNSATWPVLQLAEWEDTKNTLHLWTQIVGKIRLTLEPMVNHWWNVTLYVTARGLTTSPMPYPDGRTLTISFDFCEHRLIIEETHGELGGFALEPMTVASFYQRLMDELRARHFHVHITTMPCEVADGIAFDKDTVHASYDRSKVDAFFQILQQSDRLMKRFRSQFLGKASPVHFFWGSFDLATTRFSGRTAPQHPGGIPNLADSVTREAYSREEHSIGFWPGGFGMEAAFYAYAYPEPAGFAARPIRPSSAAWNATLKEFMLPYEAARTAADPDAAIYAFFGSTYEAAAETAVWDRELLERPTPVAAR